MDNARETLVDIVPGPRVSIVLSFRNEEHVIPELVSRLRSIFNEVLRGIIGSHELIFVNDASTDRSLRLLLDLAKGHDDIKIITMSRNFGVSPCVLAGMEHASGDAIVYMDADLQDPPEVIPNMVRLWLDGDGVDVVHTRRLSRAGESRFKLGLTKLGYQILAKVSAVNLLPEVGDFKLLSRRAVNELVKLREKKPFTRGLVNWIGFHQVVCDYHREGRYAGETKFPVTSWKVISNFLDSALISFSDIPLKLSLLVGFMVSLAAFLFIVIIVIIRILGLPYSGWATIMATMLMLGGIQLFTMGMLGLYINSIFLETKNRPNYIIESTYGFDRSAGDHVEP